MRSTEHAVLDKEGKEGNDRPTVRPRCQYFFKNFLVSLCSSVHSTSRKEYWIEAFHALRNDAVWTLETGFHNVNRSERSS